MTATVIPFPGKRKPTYVGAKHANIMDCAGIRLRLFGPAADAPSARTIAHRKERGLSDVVAESCDLVIGSNPKDKP